MINSILNQKSKQIINQLIKGEKSLTDLANIIKVSKPTILKYLDSLEKNGIISSKIKITSIGREKRYSISAYSQIFSIDPIKGIISYTIREPLDFNCPLVGQILQNEFRFGVKVFLEKILTKYKQKIVIIVYGSIARGEATVKSDLDLCLLSVKKWNENTKNQIMDAIYEGAVNTTLQAKPLFRTFNEFVKKDNSITKQIKKEGIIIHDSLDSEELWKIMQRYWNITN